MADILTTQVIQLLTAELGRAPTAAEIANGLAAPWSLALVYNGLVPGTSTLTIGPTDDIQAAVDKLNSNGGGILNLTPGTYNVAADISIPSNITIQGTNRDAVIIDFGGGAYSIKLYGAMGSPTTGIQIRTLTIQNSTAPGIDVSYSDDFFFYNFNVYSCLYGLRVANSHFPTIQFPLFDSNGYGASLTDCDGYVFSGASFDNSTTGYGLSLLRSGNSVIYNTEMVGNATYGIVMDDFTGIAISSTNVSSNTSDGVILSASVIGSQFGSMVIQSNGGWGMNIADSTDADNIVLGNFFSGNTSGQLTDSGTSTIIRSNSGVVDN